MPPSMPPDGSPARVTVEVMCGGHHVAFTLRDDGVGALPGHNCALSKAMGIADTLAARAGGRCRWLFTAAGTEVSFPLDSAACEPVQLVPSAAHCAIGQRLSDEDLFS